MKKRLSTLVFVGLILVTLSPFGAFEAKANTFKDFANAIISPIKSIINTFSDDKVEVKIISETIFIPSPELTPKESEYILSVDLENDLKELEEERRALITKRDEINRMLVEQKETSLNSYNSYISTEDGVDNKEEKKEDEKLEETNLIENTDVKKIKDANPEVVTKEEIKPETQEKETEKKDDNSTKNSLGLNSLFIEGFNKLASNVSRYFINTAEARTKKSSASFSNTRSTKDSFVPKVTTIEQKEIIVKEIKVVEKEPEFLTTATQSLFSDKKDRTEVITKETIVTKEEIDKENPLEEKEQVKEAINIETSGNVRSGDLNYELELINKRIAEIDSKISQIRSQHSFYVNYYTKKNNIELGAYSESDGGPALPYSVVYWLIPERYSSDDLQVNIEYNYDNYEEIDHRVGPGLNHFVKMENPENSLEKSKDGDKIESMLIGKMKPNESLYLKDRVYEGKIKLDDVDMGNGLRMVKIFVPAMKYKISDGKNYISKLNESQIEITFPYEPMDRSYYRYEKTLANASNYKLYRPTGFSGSHDGDIGAESEIMDYAVSTPQLLNSADIVNPNKTFDYIIVTADEFYPDSASSSYPLYEFAQHKQNYNDFDVAIVNFDDIVSQYTDGGFTYFEEGWIGSEYIGASTNSKKIRNFLSFVWDNWEANHSLDGKPLYVLLVGDADFDSSSANWFLPTPLIFNKYCEDYETCPTYGDARAAIPNDNCYADFDSDCWGSAPLMSVGRFSVQTTAELDSMVDKSIHFEANPTSGGTNVDWLSRYTTKDDHSWRQTHSYQNQMFFTKTVPAIMDKHWDVEYFRPQQLGSPFRAELEDRLEDGTVVFAHNSHGSITSGGGNGLYNFPSDGLIDNSYKNMIFLSDTCSAGGFHDGDYKSWVEKVVSDTTYPTRGAVASMGNGIIATWGRAYAGRLPAEILMKDRIQLVYDSEGNVVKTSTLGHTKTASYNEMFLGFDRTSDSSTVTDEFSNAMSINLMGDPSLDLDIFTEDYTIADTERTDEVIVQLLQFPDPNLVAGRTVQAQTFVTNVGSTTLTNLDFSLKYYSLGGTELPLYGFEGIVYSSLDTSTLGSIAPDETKLVTFDFIMPSETTFIYFKVELEEDLDEYEDNNAFVLLVNNNDPTLGEPEVGRIWMDSGDLTCSGEPPLNSNQYGSCEGSKQVCLTPSVCTGTTETLDCRSIADAECSDYYEVLDFYGDDHKVQCMLGSGGYNCYANDRVEYICTTDTPESFWIDSYKFVSGNKWRGSWDSQLLTYANRFYPSWVNKDCNARSDPADPFYDTDDGKKLSEFDTYWSVGRWDLNDYDDMEEKPQYVTDSYNCGRPGNVCKENELCLGVNCGDFTLGSTDLYEAQGYMCESAECVVVDSDQDGYADYIPGIHADRFGYDLYDDPFGHFGSWDDVNYYYTSTFFFRGSAGSTNQYRLTPPYHDWILPYDEMGYDCNDGDININPSSEEVCDGIDNNCGGVCVGGTRTGEPCSWGEEYAYELWCPGSSCYMKISYTTLGQCNYGGGTCQYVDEGLPAVETYYEDADGDGYGNPLVVLESCMEGSVPDGMSADNTDCDDTNELVHPGATELCDNIDNDCNTVIDGLTEVCGTGDCAGDKTCTAGSWGDCSSYGFDAGICAYCGPDGEGVYDESQDDDCDNFLYCDGVEECSGIGTCTTPAPINCSGSDIDPIGSCYNVPDGLDFTWDYFVGFTSTCNETTDSCEVGIIDLTHTCDVSECGAECDDSNPCENRCEANIYMTSGSCTSECGCDYSEENCDDYDAWESTGTDRWIDETSCTERQEIEEEYKDYSCGVGGCDYSVTSTRWTTTSNLRNKDDGTVCDDGAYCTDVDTCSAGTCTGSVRDCSGSDIDPIGSCYNVPDGLDLTWDSFVGFASTCNETSDSCESAPMDWEDSIEHACDVDSCGAECDAETACEDTECVSLSGCIDDDWYQYSDIENDCNAGCGCETSVCDDSLVITENDSRCVTCVDLFNSDTYDPDGDGENNVDYHHGTYWIEDSIVLCDASDYTIYKPAPQVMYMGAMVVNSDDISIDCNGANIISGDGRHTGIHLGLDGSLFSVAMGMMTGGDVADLSESRDNVIIENCNFSNFNTAMSVANSTNSTLSNNTADTNGIGLMLNGCNDLNILNNSFINNSGYSAGAEGGILIMSTDNSEFGGNTLNGNKTGLIIDASSDNNEFANTEINNNSFVGVHVYDTASGNTFNNTSACGNGYDTDTPLDIYIGLSDASFAGATCNSFYSAAVGEITSCTYTCD